MAVEWGRAETTGEVGAELISSLAFVLFTLRNSSNNNDRDLLIGQKLRFTVANLPNLDRDITVVQTRSYEQ